MKQIFYKLVKDKFKKPTRGILAYEVFFHKLNTFFDRFIVFV